MARGKTNSEGAPTKKGKQRSNGEGAIFQRKRDGKWVGEITVGWDSEGKRQIVRHTADKRSEVADWIAKRLSERQDGMLAGPSKQTVADFFTHWIETTVAHEVKQATLSLYRQMLRAHIVPGLGSRTLTKLTPQQIQSLYHDKLGTGLSPRTVQILHSVIRRGLEQAMAWGLVPRNVADAVRRPRVERKDRQPLEIEQLREFLAAAAEDRLHALYTLAALTGLRLGECLALSWKDVDLDGATLTVRHTLTKVGENFEIGSPKTSTSRRTVDLPNAVVADLRKWRKEQLQERLVLGEAWATNLVFTTTIGTALNPNNVRNRSFKPLLEKAGLPEIRFHDLRHSAATMMLAQGVQPRVVQDVLGHSDSRMTMGLYAHVLKGQKKAAADAMDALVNKK